MQVLKVIIGNRQEGKTKELLDAYYNHYTSTTSFTNVSEGISTVKTRDMLRPVFISMSFEDEMESVLKEYTQNILMSGNELSSEDIDFTDGVHKTYHNVSSIDMLRNIIASNVVEKDCTFFIDDINAVGDVDMNDVISFINSYPNDSTNNSFDIIATMSKNR